MPELRILVPANPPRAWIGIVQQGVDYHNVAATRVSDYYPVAFLIEGADGALAGGIQGNIWGGWLHIRRLWVDEWLRKRGYGTLLMASAEERARDRECIGSFLSTNSYEARPLYERLGYRLYGELHDHPVAGHNRYLMRKTLDAVIPMRTVVKDAELVMNPYPSEDQIDTIRAGIIAHATAALGLPERSIRPLYCFLRSENREIVGGALGVRPLAPCLIFVGGRAAAPEGMGNQIDGGYGAGGDSAWMQRRLSRHVQLQCAATVRAARLSGVRRITKSSHRP